MKEQAWARHYQRPWHDDAANPAFPMALRVAFLAYGTHKRNGHARFNQGEVAKVLGHPGADGIWVPADRRVVHRAIREAVKLKMLDETSKALCLVVPAHRIAGGGTGAEDAPCDRHLVTKKRSARHLRAVNG